MIWDVRNAVPALILKAHAKEVLWADWCKYNDCVLATASIDKTIKVGCYRNHTYKSLSFESSVLLCSCRFGMCEVRIHP